MRKTLLSLLISLFTLTTPTLAFAKEGTPAAGIKDQVRNKLEQLKTIRQEKQASKAATLSAIKDAKKAQVAEKLSTSLNNINQKRTESYSKFLDNAEKILNKLAEKVATAKAKGKDTTAADTAIASAQAAITSAKAAVTTQAGKDYTISSTATDSTVKNLASSQREQLRSDLQTTEAVIKAAKKAVADAIRTTATTVFGEKIKGATKSGEVNK